MASVLMNYHIGSGILQSHKTKQVLIASEDSYLENLKLYVCADGLLVLTESQKYKNFEVGLDPPIKIYLRIFREF